MLIRGKRPVVVATNVSYFLFLPTGPRLQNGQSCTHVLLSHGYTAQVGLINTPFPMHMRLGRHCDSCWQHVWEPAHCVLLG